MVETKHKNPKSCFIKFSENVNESNNVIIKLICKYFLLIFDNFFFNVDLEFTLLYVKPELYYIFYDTPSPINLLVVVSFFSTITNLR